MLLVRLLPACIPRGGSSLCAPKPTISFKSGSSCPGSASQPAAHSCLSAGSSLSFAAAAAAAHPARGECFYSPDSLCQRPGCCRTRFHSHSHPAHASSSCRGCRRARPRPRTTRRPCPLVRCTRLRCCAWPACGSAPLRASSRRCRLRIRL